MDFKQILQENGWLGATIIVLIQFVYTLWKDQSKKDRKLLEQIQLDVNMSFAFLRVMSGDKYAEIVKKINDEKLMRGMRE